MAKRQFKSQPPNFIHVRDTNYPCITVYGTAGKPVNIIERNLCYRSADHTMQVQGVAKTTPSK